MEKGEDLVSRAYEKISLMILDYKLKPGSQISDFVLSRTLGMSRTPIRCAIMKLQADGLVEINEASGFKVVDLNKSLVDKYCNAKRIIYPAILSEVIGKGIPDSTINRLNSNLTAVRENIGIDNEKVYKAIVDSNNAIYSLISNELLQHALKTLEVYGNLIMRLILVNFKSEELEVAKSFIEALANGEQDKSIALYLELNTKIHQIETSAIVD